LRKPSRRRERGDEEVLKREQPRQPPQDRLRSGAHRRLQEPARLAERVDDDGRRAPRLELLGKELGGQVVARADVGGHDQDTASHGRNRTGSASTP
jgi:hypothetical protein